MFTVYKLTIKANKLLTLTIYYINQVFITIIIQKILSLLHLVTVTYWLKKSRKLIRRFLYYPSIIFHVISGYQYYAQTF